MLYPMTERQESFVDLAQKLAEKFDARAATHDQQNTFPLANYEDARAVGLPALVVPKEFGGWGANLLETVMTTEALAVGDGSTALCLAMHMHSLGATAESRKWPPALFEKICRAAVEKGAMINSIATEPELGSPSRGGIPKTTAEPIFLNGTSAGEPKSWRVNGLKTWATMIPALDYMVTPAALQDGSGDVARFVVPISDQVEIIENWDSMGMRGTASHDIRLNDAEVPNSNIIGRSNSAAPTSGGGINAWFMLCISAVYVGVAVAAQRAAIRYAQKRVPTALGKPIAEVEGVQRRLGEVELLLRQSRVMLYQAADMWSSLPERRSEMKASVITAKYTATNCAVRAVDECMRVAGGASMMKTLPLERYYRDVRAGLNHPMNDDVTLITLGQGAIAALKN